VAELAEKLEMLELLNSAPLGLIYIHMSEGCSTVTIMLMHAKFCSTCSSHCLGGWPPFNDLGLSSLSKPYIVSIFNTNIFLQILCWKFERKLKL
jgi:hypothetical protein